MRARTVLVKDETGRWKLSVTLPGGRYQLSLDDAAVNLLRHQVGLIECEAVPDLFVPVLVATRDAWFPKETDTESVVESLPSGGDLSAGERSALAEYVRSVRVNPRDADLVWRVVEGSPVSDTVDVDDLNVASLPDVPDDVDLGGGGPGEAAEEDGATEAASTPEQGKGGVGQSGRRASARRTRRPRSPPTRRRRRRSSASPASGRRAPSNSLPGGSRTRRRWRTPDRSTWPRWQGSRRGWRRSPSRAPGSFWATSGRRPGASPPRPRSTPGRSRRRFRRWRPRASRRRRPRPCWRCSTGRRWSRSTASPAGRRTSCGRPATGRRATSRERTPPTSRRSATSGAKTAPAIVEAARELIEGEGD